MRVLLVFPTPFESGRLGLENVVWLSEPVSLTSVGTAVKGEHEVRVLDLRLEAEGALADELLAFRPDVVGTTSMTTDAYQAKAVLRMAKSILPDSLTVIGGHHPTLSPQEFHEPYIDVIVQGEGEHTFKELCTRHAAQRASDAPREFSGIAGLRWLDASGARNANEKRSQATSLDELPMPDRSLIAKYQGRYFFTAVRPMASIFTSRGCSFDCNFCAIWEFYERRTRYLSAKNIVDQMEACAEPFIFVLDDNFLSNKKRILELCEEIEKRGAKKYWMTQGRTDFVAENPEIMARLARCGLVGLLSGFESNDDDNLAALRKKNNWENNVRASEIMEKNGIFSTGIFMVRPDWTKEQFQALYDYMNSLTIGIPIVTILTPLPGTQLYRAYKDKLMSNDHRLFDLLHPMLPTRLPREEFYKEFARSYDDTEWSVRKAFKAMLKTRKRFLLKMLPGLLHFYARSWRYQRVHRDYTSFLRDEEGLLNGPGAKLSWKDVQYPTGDEDHAQDTAQSSPGAVVKLRVPRRLWTDDLADAREKPAVAAGGSR
jgi:hopanoid C-3 methylase